MVGTRGGEGVEGLVWPGNCVTRQLVVPFPEKGMQSRKDLRGLGSWAFLLWLIRQRDGP